MKFKTIEWKEDHIRILDQRKLPHEIRYLEYRNASSIAKAIQTMAIRGAPAIGVAAAMGIALAAQKNHSIQTDAFHQSLKKICHEMLTTRPTAVNLFWAVDRMEKILDQVYTEGILETKKRLVKKALEIYQEDREANQRIGRYGKTLIKNGDGILTHCNAGALATAGYGTALGVLYGAWSEGKRFHVFVDETRPMLQGARLTAWELEQSNIPVTLIADNMAGWLMKQRKINLVIVGADRVARNGDVANKIGSYSLAVLSRYHGIPFYVAAPISTFDMSLATGREIPIEERNMKEVTHFQGKWVAPKGVGAINPAFDVTPHSLIEAIITEKGILRKPFQKNLKRLIPPDSPPLERGR